MNVMAPVQLIDCRMTALLLQRQVQDLMIISIRFLIVHQNGKNTWVTEIGMFLAAYKCSRNDKIASARSEQAYNAAGL